MGMLYITQWITSPDGASGSSQIIAKLLAPGAFVLRVSGGEIFSPWHVYFLGIIVLSLNALLLISVFNCFTGLVSSLFRVSSGTCCCCSVVSFLSCTVGLSYLPWQEARKIIRKT